MTTPSAAVLASLATLAATLPAPPRDNQCTATQSIDLDPDIWGDDDYHHRCTYDTGHDTVMHHCRYCSHTWPIAEEADK